VTGPCEHANESSGSIKGREFLDKLIDYQLPRKLVTFRQILSVWYAIRLFFVSPHASMT
jgi:hypothetical protein